MTIAYIMAVVFSRVFAVIGKYLGGGLISFLLIKASVSFRSKVAGFCSGIGAVAVAVFGGFGIFRIIVGPESFALGPFLASTLPLLLTIRRDLRDSRRVKTTLKDIAESNAEHAAFFSKEVGEPSGPCAVGEIVGLVLAAVWFFTQYH